MACTGGLEIGKYHFSYTCGTGIGDGIVIHPDHLPKNGLNDSEYLEAFKTALEIYPVLSAKSYVMEYAGYDLSEIGDHESILHNMDIVEKQDRLNYDKEVFNRMRHDMKAIRSGAYKKQAPNSSKKSDPGYVYLLKNMEGTYKIGKAKNPEDRLKTFTVKLPFRVEYTCIIPSHDMAELERDLHDLFKHKRVNGEWFNLDPDDVEFIKGLAS